MSTDINKNTSANDERKNKESLGKLKGKINRLYLISFVIPFVISFISLIICGIAPFGSKDILTMTHNESYLTNLLKVYDYIHGTYNNESTREIWATLFTDPTILVSLIFGRAAIPGALSILYAIKLGLSGMCFSYYLNNKKSSNNASKNNIIIITLSLAYSLSNYMISYGMNISILSVICVFPILMHFLDKLILENNWKGYYITLCISIIFNLYMTIVLLIFSTIYALLSNHKSVLNLAKKIVFKFSIDLLSILSTFFIVIPGLYNGFAKDFYISEAPQNIKLIGFFDVFKGFLTGSEASCFSNKCFNVNIFSGIIVVLLCILYILNPKKSILEKLRTLTLLLILYLSTTITGLNYIMNGFIKGDYLNGTFNIAFIFVMLSISFDVLTNISDYTKKNIVISTSLTILLILSTIMFTKYYNSLYIFSISFILTIVYGTILFFICKLPEVKKHLYFTIGILMIIELSACYINNLYTAKKISPNYEATYEANKYVLELNALAYNPKAKILYYNANNQDFNPIINTLNGIDYVICPNDLEAPDSYLNYVTDIGNASIYQYSKNIKEPILTTDEIKKWTYSKTNSQMSSNSLLKYIDKNSSDIYYVDDYYASLTNLKTVKNKSNISLDENSNLLVSISDTPTKDIIIDNETVKPISANNLLWYVPISKGNHTISFRDINYRKAPISLSICIIISIITLSSVLISLYKRDIAKKIVKDLKLTSIIANFFESNYVYILSIVIPSIVLLIAAFLRNCVPFGNSSVLAGDGYVQSYPYIQNLINNLGLKSYIPSTIGFGALVFSSGGDPITNFINTTIQLIFRSFIWTNDGKLYSAIYYSFYVVFSGPAIVFYITHRYSGTRYNKKDSRLLLIALCYTLSAYLIGYFCYNNFQYGIYIPLICLALEKLIYKNKPLAYIILLSYIMIRGYYSAFLICEFLVLYVLTLDYKNAKSFLRKFANFAISSILSAGLAAYTLIPSFMGTLSSANTVSDTSSSGYTTGVSGSFWNAILKDFNQYQAGQNSVVMTADTEMVNIYFGLLPLICIVIYLFNSNIKIGIRLRKAFVLLLLFLSFSISKLNYIFHGFHYQTNVPNRFSLFFIFLGITIFADTLVSYAKMEKQKIMYIITLTSLVIFFMWISYPSKNISSYSLSVTCIISYILISYATTKNIWNKRTAIRIMSFITTIEVLLGSVMSFTTSIGYSNVPLEENISAISTLAEDIKKNNKNDIYLSEYVTNSIYSFNMCNIYGLNTMTGFSSSISNNTKDLVSNWGILASRNNIKYSTGNPLADMMLHVKYQFIDAADSELANASIYNPIAVNNNIVLYENPYYLGVGFLTDTNLKEWSNIDFSSYDNAIAYQNSFANEICGKSLYRTLKINKNVEQVLSETEEPNLFTPNFVTALSPEKEKYRSENTTGTYFDAELVQSSLGNYDLVGTLHTAPSVEGNIYISYGSNILYVGNLNDEETELPFIIHDYTGDLSLLDITFGVLDTSVLESIHDTFSQSTLTDIKRDKKSFTGTIDAKNDGILYLSLPHNSNLNFYIDGKPVKSFDYLNGIGIELNKGLHTIKVEGEYSVKAIYICISIISIILIILYIFALKKLWPVLKEKLDNVENGKQKERNKVKILANLSSTKLTYILTFIMSFIIILFSLIYSGFKPFGPRDVFTANDQSDYIRRIYELYDVIHNGKSIFTNSYHEGAGYNITSLLTYYLSDPLNFVALILPKNMILSFLNILYALKVAVCALNMNIYLSYRKKLNYNILKKGNRSNPGTKKKDKKSNFIIGGSNKVPNILKPILQKTDICILGFSILYAFSNYNLGPGLNVAMQGAVAIFPLLLLGLDKIIYEGNSKLYIITYILSFFLNFRITIISTIFLLMYFIVNIYSSKNNINKKIIIRKWIISSIISILSSAIIIIPNIISTFWKNNITAVGKPFISVSFFDITKMMMVTTKPALILAYGNNIYIYSSILSILLFICYIFNTGISLKRRISLSILYIIVFLGHMISSLNIILNGFEKHKPEVPILCLFDYTFIFISIVIAYEEVINIRKQKSMLIILSAIFTALIILGTMFLSTSYGEASTYIRSLEYVFFYSIILIIYSDRSMTKWLMKLTITTLLIIEIFTSFIPSMKKLSWLTYKYENTNDYLYETMLNELDKEDKNSNKLILNYYDNIEENDLKDSEYKYIIWNNGKEPFTFLKLYDDSNRIRIFENTTVKPNTQNDKKMKQESIAFILGMIISIISISSVIIYFKKTKNPEKKC